VSMGYASCRKRGLHPDEARRLLSLTRSSDLKSQPTADEAWQSLRGISKDIYDNSDFLKPNPGNAYYGRNPEAGFKPKLDWRKDSLTVFQKDAIVFGTQSANGYLFSMISSALTSLLWKSDFQFRAELRALILLVLIIITGVAVTPVTSG
jgi:hypothetical protein